MINSMLIDSSVSVRVNGYPQFNPCSSSHTVIRTIISANPHNPLSYKQSSDILNQKKVCSQVENMFNATLIVKVT